MSQAEQSMEARILQAMRLTLAAVIRDTATPAGMRHPLSDATIEDMRQCLALISARERELAQAAGAGTGARPRFADEAAAGDKVVRFHDRKPPGGKSLGLAGMAQEGCGALEPYALRVLGDSMAPEFADGCIVIVDPGHVPHDGSYVIVEFAGDIFFRQLVIDGERRFLKPLNPRYGSFELVPPYTIRGGVVQQAGRRRSQRRHYD